MANISGNNNNNRINIGSNNLNQKEKLEILDFAQYIVGAWKRNLEWRYFGGPFAFLRSTNNVVVVSEDTEAAKQPGTRFLKWAFGKSFQSQDLVTAYTIQVS